LDFLRLLLMKRGRSGSLIFKRNKNLLHKLWLAVALEALHGRRGHLLTLIDKEIPFKLLILLLLHWKNLLGTFLDLTLDPHLRILEVFWLLLLHWLQICFSLRSLLINLDWLCLDSLLDYFLLLLQLIELLLRDWLCLLS
jgi:hypothetical protein